MPKRSGPPNTEAVKPPKKHGVQPAERMIRAAKPNGMVTPPEPDPAIIAASIKDYLPGIAEAEKRRQKVDAKVKEMAKLDPLDYDLERVAAAKEIELPVGRLDKHVEHERAGRRRSAEPPDIVPWHEPVDGVQLLDEIAAAFKRHIGLPTRGEQALALWVVHTHCLAAVTVSPRLALSSPTPGCGKTNTLEMIATMVSRPLHVESITAAAVFRSIELWRPVLLLDEGESYMMSRSELVNIVNSGNKPNGGVVRVEGEANDRLPVLFSTFSAVATAQIGRLPANLASRAVHLHMQRLGVGERREPYDEAARPYAHLGRMAKRWAADNLEALCKARPVMPGKLRNRDSDVWRILLSIADVAGGYWAGEAGFAREAALSLTDVEDSFDTRTLVLADIRSVFRAHGMVDLPSEMIAEELAKMEHRAWAEFGRQEKPITKTGIARLLAPFKITSGKVYDPRNQGSRLQGYTAASFADAWGRYLPSEDT